MDELIGRMAREFGAYAISVRYFAPDASRPHETWPWLYLFDRPLSEFSVACENTRLGAEALPGVLRTELANSACALLRRFLLESPVPGPVSEARLKDVADARAAPGGWSNKRLVDAVIDDLTAQLAHLTRLVQLMACDEDWQRFDGAFKLGLAEGACRQREADVKRIVEAAGLPDSDATLGDMEHFAHHVEVGPLVSDRREDES